jgi:large subunit ribosomal protein L21
MYAVIESGGKQHRVQVGQVVRVERMAAEIGSRVVFDRVLMVGGGYAVRVGAPTVAGASVTGSVVEQDRHKKIVTFLYKKTQNSNRKRMGHRQDYTAVKIDAIEPGAEG